MERSIILSSYNSACNAAMFLIYQSLSKSNATQHNTLHLNQVNLISLQYGDAVVDEDGNSCIATHRSVCNGLICTFQCNSVLYQIAQNFDVHATKMVQLCVLCNNKLITKNNFA